jgi:hypothetical protein
MELNKIDRPYRPPRENWGWVKAKEAVGRHPQVLAYLPQLRPHPTYTALP